MPTKTKTPTRKAKKPTLADRFKSLHLEIFDARGATVSHINSVNDRVTELFKLLECRLPKPTDPPPAEKWVPKVGDWVWNDARGIGKVLYPSGPHFAVTFPGHNGGWKAETGDEHCWYVGALNIRPATPAEIAEHKRPEEWAKVDRLQDGDACLGTESFRTALAELNMPTYSDGTLTGVWDTIGWENGRLIGIGRGMGTQLPEAEFLRRAKGTAARLKSEAEARELAMPLEFGTRVKVKGREEENWRIACDEPTDDGYWRLAPPKCGNLNTMTAKRSEFTIIP